MLKVKRLHPDAIIPTCANPGEDLAYDLYALKETLLKPGQVEKVRTGIAATFDDGSVKRWGLLVRDRSSMAAQGVTTSGGVIDAGYRGEILVLLTSAESRLIKKGDKIAQMIPMPVATGAGVQEVDELAPAIRGANGFGSTGR